jgi:hypothetical protein
MSDNQHTFVLSIQTRLKETCLKQGGGAVADYPYDSLYVHPPDPTCQAFPGVEPFYLQKVFVWVPEARWPAAFPAGTPSCPRCERANCVRSNGFVPHVARRVVGERSTFYMTGRRYECKACMRANKESGECVARSGRA